MGRQPEHGRSVPAGAQEWQPTRQPRSDWCSYVLRGRLEKIARLTCELGGRAHRAWRTGFALTSPSWSSERLAIEIPTRSESSVRRHLAPREHQVEPDFDRHEQ